MPSLLRIAVPIVPANILQSAYQLTDAFWVGRLGGARAGIARPVVFTKPWRQRQILHLRPGERLREYECIENNEDLLRIEKLLQDESTFRVTAP